MIIKFVEERVGVNLVEVYLDFLSENEEERDALRHVYNSTRGKDHGMLKLSGVCRAAKLRIFLWRE